MNAEPSDAPQPGSAAKLRSPSPIASRAMALFLTLLVVVSLVSTGLLWQKISSMRETLARQSAEAQAQSMEARAAARQAQDLARETAARQAVADARLSEATLQRTQLDDLMLSLSRSRDETLVVDMESSLRLAQQQAQLTLSVEPLLAALKSADQRVERAAHPRLEPVRRAIAHDIERIAAAQTADTPSLLSKLDDLVRQIDELPLLNAAVPAVSSAGHAVTPAPAEQWWLRALALVRAEAVKLLRVSRIDQPEAALLAPEQSYFLRENLKLKLLNVRMGLLARQFESARADAAAAASSLHRYFDPAARRTQQVVATLSQVQSQLTAVELPRVDETLSALATAAAGR